jgi:hypothetical protein
MRFTARIFYACGQTHEFSSGLSMNEAAAPRQTVAVKTLVAALLGIAVLALCMTYFLRCPCERIPGSMLSGDVVQVPVKDWSLANQVRLCQVQVNGLVPWSINLNCMADAEGALFLSCSRCDGKYWSGVAVKDPQARLRIGRRLYPVNLTRVTDSARLDHAWRTRAAKTGMGVGQPRPEHWWSFAVTSLSR